MQKTSAVLGSAFFFVVAPYMAAGLIPWWITHWKFELAFLAVEVTRAVGVLLILTGVPGVVNSFARFAVQGLGAPAPVAPPQRLVSCIRARIRGADAAAEVWRRVRSLLCERPALDSTANGVGSAVIVSRLRWAQTAWSNFYRGGLGPLSFSIAAIGFAIVATVRFPISLRTQVGCSARSTLTALADRE